MSWIGTANNETVSFNDLIDAVSLGYFYALTTIPTGLEQITKTDASTYVNVNTAFAPFAAKTSLQLVVKGDLTPVFEYSGTFYYSGTAGGGFWEGWDNGAVACANYGANSSTAYWNGTLGIGTIIYTSNLISASTTFVLVYAGTAYYLNADYIFYYDSVLGLYASEVYDFGACVIPTTTTTTTTTTVLCDEYINNLGTDANGVNYTDCNGTVYTNQTIAPNQTICVQQGSLNGGDSGFLINLGSC